MIFRIRSFYDPRKILVKIIISQIAEATDKSVQLLETTVYWLDRKLLSIENMMSVLSKVIFIGIRQSIVVLNQTCW